LGGQVPPGAIEERVVVASHDTARPMAIPTPVSPARRSGCCHASCGLSAATITTAVVIPATGASPGCPTAVRTSVPTRSPLERKPIYVDLESPTLLRVLARFLRPAAEKTPHAPVILTEMLPAPDECWLADAAASGVERRR
jgi:hypothetical protein